ncbi:hypothetical protein F9B74_08350 [Pelistega sp. NLN82]|uniref:Uncharacterized protein n=1 Tax=Pelistega ratti TaxID=2652177 RepID=A0A6L9Y916_9BURK|nr:hypothetical protein [Pelistega ratti]NEN76328.1 hypothetical protein [Pelistega ratti]
MKSQNKNKKVLGQNHNLLEIDISAKNNENKNLSSEIVSSDHKEHLSSETAQSNNADITISVDKLMKELKEAVLQPERTLSILEESREFRFFNFFLVFVFSFTLVFFTGMNDFNSESFRSFISHCPLMILLLSLTFAFLHSKLYQFPLTVFTFSAFFAFLMGNFIGSLSGAFGFPVKAISVVVAELNALFILIVAEAMISFYTKSYLQNRLYQGGVKGFLRVLGSYLLSLYLVLIVDVFRPLEKLSIDEKDLWIMFDKQFLLYVPLIIVFSIIRYKFPRLKANTLNLIIFCSIVVLGNFFLGKNTNILSDQLGHLPYEEWRQISETLQSPSIPYWSINYHISSVILWFFIAEGMLFLALLCQDVFWKDSSSEGDIT